MAKRKQAFKKATQMPPKGALREAAISGNALAVKNLLRRGARVDERNDDGETPLMAAVSAGSKECVQLLIDARADVNAKDNGGDTALIVAADRDQAECAKLLIEHGATVDERRANGMTPLLTAIWHGYAETALLLIEKGADVNEKTDEGDPALVRAAADDNAALNAVAIALINKGAKLEATGPAGTTPLICAAWGGNTPLVRYLAKKGANLDATVQGRTALKIARDEGFYQTVDVLEQAYAERQRKKEAAIQKAADGFTTGLSKPITANKPLTFKKS